ncbi:hypothetical protein GCM10027062_19920 [Nocardioides hungaricus]
MSRALRLPAIVAALACGLGALAVLQASGTGAAATTPVACTATSNPLGAATGWTEFVETDGNRGAESEGSIAYGGSFSGSGFTVGTFLPTTTPPSTPTLVVAGSHGSFNLQRGSAYVTPQTNVNFNGGPGTGYLASNPVDFGTAFTQLRATSATFAAYSPNGTATTVTSNPLPGGQVTLVLSGTDPDLNVFQIAAADLGSKQVGIDVPQGSTVIVNVTGTAPSFNNNMLIKQGSSWDQASDGVVKPGQQTAAGWPGILWNFPDATSVQIDSGSAFAGTVLAPDAAVTVGNAGHTIGQMIAKSFSSQRETHLNLFPSTVCLPGPPSTPGDSDVRIAKTASVSNPQGGDFVTYTLLVENVGASPADGVVVTDQLPAGVTFDSASAPCTQSGGTVTCNVGTLAAGASTTLWIKVVANPVAGAGPVSQPQANHWVTPYKAEQQVDLQPGEQKSVTLSCNPGDILSDGQFRVDQVDQDTGTLADDIEILSSQLSGLGVGTWKGVIRNDATGRAQAKAFIVCLPAQTEPADRQTGYSDSHRHPLSADPAPVTSTATYAAGEQSATLTCPAGTIPVAPGFDAPAGGVVLRGSEYDESSPRDWRFTLDVAAPTTVTLSARCLRTTVGPVYGHTHDLRFTHVVKTFTVDGFTAKEGDEFKVSCPDDAKGVVATWDLPKGLRHFGNDPRLKERAFRIFNDTGQAKQVTLDLQCLRDRTSTERMGTTDPVVVPNVATVTSTSVDANPFNNSSTATITVRPGSSTASVLGSGRVAAGAFAVRVASSMPGRGALTVRSRGALLAKGTVGLKAGGTTAARLKLTWAGKVKLRKLDRVTVRVDPTRGRTTSRTVRVQR